MPPSSVAEPRLDSTEPATTPVCTGRDRFIDVLRAFAILVIVGQHWMPPVMSGDSAMTTGDFPAVLEGWPSAWLSPAMPLIFFTGGAAAAVSLRIHRDLAGTTGRPTVSWLAERTIRLALPALPIVAVMLPLYELLVSAGVRVQPVDWAAGPVGRLLWFFAAYTLLVTLTPVLVRLHDRCRGREALVMAVCAFAVDIAGFAEYDRTSPLGPASTVLVLGAIYQTGIAYSRGRLRHVRRPQLAALCVGGLAGCVLAFGPYVLAAITMPGEPPPSTNPPAVALLGWGLAQLGLALTLRGAVSHWASHPPVGTMLDRISARTTTIYLWHVPALVPGLVVMGFDIEALQPFGNGRQSDAPLRLAAFTVVLAGLVGVSGHYERRARSRLARIGSKGRAILNANRPVYRMGSAPPGRKT